MQLHPTSVLIYTSFSCGQLLLHFTHCPMAVGFKFICFETPRAMRLMMHGDRFKLSLLLLLVTITSLRSLQIGGVGRIRWRWGFNYWMGVIYH